MSAAPRLVLIDGHALLYRAYHALPQEMVTSRGEYTNAIYGFLSTLLKVVADEKPEYVIVCLDKGRTFRHDLYDEYKAHRAKMPDDLRPQVERTEQVLQALGIPTYAVEGYEADDLIGTLSRQATEADLDTLIVTGDADALQLVDEHVNVLVPGRRYSETVCYDEDRVRERYGFGPTELVEFKALKGDPSDNIPGVPGVGDKTATKLVQEYGTLEKIYESLDLVPSRYRKALEDNREQAFFSRKLATIVTDAPAQLDLESSRFGDYDREQVVQLFRELEFRSLLGRLPGTEGPAEPTPVPTAKAARQMSLFEEAAVETAAVVHLPSYHTVRDRAGLDRLLAALGKGPLAFDTETTSLQPLESELVGISLAVPDGRSWYIPLTHRSPDGARLADQLSWDEVRERLSPLLDNRSIPKYAHNAKFDMLVLAEQGLDVHGVVSDTMIAAHLLGERSVGLKGLAFKHVGVEMRTIEDLLGTGKSQRTMDQVPIEEVSTYACADADMTCRLQALLAPRLAEQGLQSLFEDVEMPLVEVLADMERAGVRLDTGFLGKMSHELQNALAELEETIHRLAGHPFNVNSTQQLSEVLFHELGLPLTATSKLKSGAYSTASDVLERLRGLHPVVEAVINYRELSKLSSTYVDALPRLVSTRTGRVHTSFNQTATATGRLSSSDPNLQNIPIRTDVGRQVRQAFITDPGWVLLAADYSQVELRILAHLSDDPGLLEAFAQEEDIHASTAATLFGVPTSQVTAEQRRTAKTVNFGLMYGMSEYGLAQRLGIDHAVAAHFIATYFARYASVQSFFAETLRLGRERGYVSTILGRRRYIPALRSSNRNVRAAAEREAINAPIQGSAADIIKIAMVRLHAALKERGLRSRMVLQVHDELVLEVPEEEAGVVVPLVKETMEGAFALRAPLRVDIHTGSTWGELK